MDFVLAMLGPITVAAFRDYLHPSAWRDDLPAGLGGSPVNLLCRELLRRGQRLVILTLDPAVQDEVVLEGARLRICIGPFRPNRARDFFRAERRYLLGALSREHPDVIHAQWTYEYALAAQASGLPHVITAHDAPLNILRHNVIPYRIARTLMAYAVVARARTIVSVSPYVADHLRRFMFYRGATQIIPNGMPGHLFSRGGHARPSGTNVTYATVLNGWGGLKNGGKVIEAFARVRKTRPRDRLIMFGAGHGDAEAAARWARKRGIAAGIEFAGSMPHDQLLDTLAAGVDILVHPSLEEAQPMAVLEAMAIGIPVVGGRASGGVPWTLDEGRAGVLIDIGRVDPIHDAMVRLATNRVERERLGGQGQAHASRRFHIRAVAEAYEATYSELLGQA